MIEFLYGALTASSAYGGWKGCTYLTALHRAKPKRTSPKGLNYDWIDQQERDIWGPPISEQFDEFVDDLVEFGQEIRAQKHMMSVSMKFDEDIELLNRISRKWSKEPIEFPQPEGAYNKEKWKAGYKSHRDRMYTAYREAAYATSDKKERRMLLDMARAYD